jgi:hypothetical protein
LAKSEGKFQRSSQEETELPSCSPSKQEFCTMPGLTIRVAQELVVVAPMLAILGAGILFVLLLRKRDGQVEVFELGVFYAGLVFIYSIYPMLAYLTGGLRFSAFADARLSLAQPSPREMAAVVWYFFVYFVFFLVGYLLVRGRCKLEIIRFARPDPRMLLVLVVLYAAVKAFFIFLRLYYEVRSPETYVDSYLLYADLPLIVQQVANHLGQIELTLQVVFMAYLTLNYRRYRYIIFGLIALEFFTLFFYGIGARTGLFVLLVSFLATYHLGVKQLTIPSAIVMGLVALVLFTFLGILRDNAMAYADSPKNPLAYDSEFESVFATSYDLLHREGTSEAAAIPPSFYISDFMNLVPQQFLPTQKVDPTRWYVESYYPAYALSGGGLAFGAVSEAMVGLGRIDAAWRGAIIGVIFALIHRAFVNGAKSFWKYCFYLWMIVFSYQCFRGTTFKLVPQFFYEFLSVVIVVRVILGIVPLEQKNRFEYASTTKV